MGVQSLGGTLGGHPHRSWLMAAPWDSPRPDPGGCVCGAVAGGGGGGCLLLGSHLTSL